MNSRVENVRFPNVYEDAISTRSSKCRKAIGRGIMVNSIYCGNPGDEIAPAWREVATLADGKFHAIDKSFDAIETVYGMGYRWISD